ncbi:MAG TPA: NAD-dependent epimerase/dehydratase family protein, partial [Baekduia sp.]|nr:NAD-dependent epimerase/dehydratase family protein [Baekduia sp.]
MNSGSRRSFIAGGAGFIGSHMTRRLLEDPAQEVVVFDNLSSGTKDYLDGVLDDERLTFVTGDLQDLDATVAAIEGCDRMFLYAANPDIAKAVTEPTIDFWQGTYLTNNAIEAARVAGVKKIIYSSGSGVYGDRGEEAVVEDVGGMHPVSTYGASKLACEAMMSAYSHMFGLDVVVFRFANVVGPRQTHGVTYDFVRKLRDDPTRLTILGDGQQSKSYIHVSDVVDAMLKMADADGRPFDVFNAGTLDY